MLRAAVVADWAVVDWTAVVAVAGAAVVAVVVADAGAVAARAVVVAGAVAVVAGAAAAAAAAVAGVVEAAVAAVAAEEGVGWFSCLWTAPVRAADKLKVELGKVKLWPKD